MNYPFLPSYERYALRIFCVPGADWVLRVTVNTVLGIDLHFQIIHSDMPCAHYLALLVYIYSLKALNHWTCIRDFTQFLGCSFLMLYYCNYLVAQLSWPVLFLIRTISFYLNTQNIDNSITFCTFLCIAMCVVLGPHINTSVNYLVITWMK